jgi:hypothetical protein
MISVAFGGAQWTRLTPMENTAPAVALARDRWRATAAPEAAVWTVEQGIQQRQLHLNIIHPRNNVEELSGVAMWKSGDLSEPRHAGAYIAKAEQAPERATFGGRTSGHLGPMWRWLATQPRVPLVQGLALQLAIAPEHMEITAAAHRAELGAPPPPLPEFPVKTWQRNIWKYSDRWPDPHQPLPDELLTPRDRARELAQRYLPDLICLTRLARWINRSH